MDEQNKKGTFASCLRAYLGEGPFGVQAKLDDLKAFVTDKEQREDFVAELQVAGYEIVQG